MNRFNYPKPTARIVTMREETTPPPLPVPMVTGQRFRYRAVGHVINIEISWASIRNLIFLATGSTTAYSLIQAVKLSKITVYAPSRIGTSVGADAEPGNVRILLGPGVQQNNAGTSGYTFIGKPKSVSATPVGTQGVKLVCKVPANSAIGDWHWLNQLPTTAMPTAFELTVPEGAIVDLQLTLRFASDLSGGAAQNVALVTAGATAGVFYYNNLDNTTVATGASGAGILKPFFADNILSANTYG